MPISETHISHGLPHPTTQTFFPYAPPDDESAKAQQAQGQKQGEGGAAAAAAVEVDAGAGAGAGGDHFFSGAPTVAAMEVDEDGDGVSYTRRAVLTHGSCFLRGPCFTHVYAQPTNDQAAASINAAAPPAPREPPLVLDGTTLANLEVFTNSYDRTAKGGWVVVRWS